MQFLRTLFWVVIAVAAVAFSYNNWKTVQLALWGGLIADVNLPLLIFGAFLLGLLPPYILHRATRWSLKRRLETTQRALAEARGSEPVVTTISDGTLVTGTSPIAVPPAVS